MNAAGANFAFRRELDGDAVARAAIIAVDSKEQAQIEAGDLIEPFKQDSSGWVRVCELAEIVSGKVPGRAGAEQITLFKSVGIATWDIAVAARVFERAERQGLGRHVPLGGLKH